MVVLFFSFIVIGYCYDYNFTTLNFTTSNLTLSNFTTSPNNQSNISLTTTTPLTPPPQNYNDVCNTVTDPLPTGGGLCFNDNDCGSLHSGGKCVITNNISNISLHNYCVCNSAWANPNCSYARTRYIFLLF